MNGQVVQRHVRFAEFSEVKHYERPSSKANYLKSYNSSDYKKFRQTNNQDIINCSRMVEIKIGIEELSLDDICMCTGLELFLAPDVPKRIEDIKKSRKMHVARVLFEQVRQGVMKNRYDEDSIESIARVSKKSSHRDRDRSFKIAYARVCGKSCG